MDKLLKIDSIRACKTFSLISKEIGTLDRSKITPRHCSSIGRIVAKLVDAPDIKIGLLSNFTMDMLPAYLSFAVAAEGLQCETYLGEFNQYGQEILKPDSGLAVFKPDILFLSVSMRQLVPEIVFSFSSLSDQKKEKVLNWIVDHLTQTIDNATQRYKATILLSNFPMPTTPQFGIADNNMKIGEMLFYYELNTRLIKLAHGNPRVHIFDLAKLSGLVGAENVFDSKMYYMAKILWSETFNLRVAEELSKYVIGLKGLTKKCLILDLDNTLWGGILGEDGIEGVKVGPGDPVSEAYFDFQCKIRSLKDRGIMLAVCSKNNENDVFEMFKNRTAMPLKLSDFSSYQINWDHKHLNIQRIAQDLNIGMDSIVFIDDNPVECDLVHQMLPEVKTLLLPGNVEKIPDVLDTIVDFEKIVVLNDDLQKTEQYHQNKQREKLKEFAVDLEGYLHSLETEIQLFPAAKENLDRVHQLFTKTNQFNLTTIRYSPSDIENFLLDDRYELCVASAHDRFGDMGIIGLYLVDCAGQDYRIDSMILSCRAMGRGVETAIMNHLKAQYSEKQNNRSIKATYIPTKKNIPVKNFYEEQGFKVVKKNPDKIKQYLLTMDNCQQIECSWIKITDKR